MANEPKQAREKRPDPGERRNAQGDHEGSAHRPEEFDVMNPAKQGLGDRGRATNGSDGGPEIPSVDDVAGVVVSGEQKRTTGVEGREAGLGSERGASDDKSKKRER